MSIQDKSLLLLTPSVDHKFTGNYLMSFVNLLMCCINHRIPMSFYFVWNESHVSRARNRLADYYMKVRKETNCIMIDDDIGFEHMDIMAMLESDKDVIGAPCVTKQIRWDNVQQAIQNNPGRQFTDAEMKLLAANYVLNFEPLPGGGTRTIDIREVQDMRNLGTGCLMIKRSTFERIKQCEPNNWYESGGDPNAIPGPIWDFFPAGVNYETRDFDSEDYGFCMKVKKYGMKVWMCPWMKTTHFGSYEFAGDIHMLIKAGLQLGGAVKESQEGVLISV